MRKRLTEEYLNMHKLYRDIIGVNLITTHLHGKHSIDVYSTTNRVEVEAVSLPSKKWGIRYCLCFIVDIKSELILGSNFPPLVKLGTRN